MTEVQDYLFIENHKILDQHDFSSAELPAYAAIAHRDAEYPNAQIYVRVADWNVN